MVEVVVEVVVEGGGSGGGCSGGGCAVWDARRCQSSVTWKRKALIAEAFVDTEW